MRIPRLYSDVPLSAHSSVVLGEAAAHYLAKVLRMSAGRELIVFDGQGGEYQAQIAVVDKKSLTLNLGAFNPELRESPLAVELAIGLSRGERFEWVLQKATELGVAAISPLVTERIEVKLSGDRLSKKLEHWRQIIISACEQCGRTRVPRLVEPRLLSQWLAQRPAGPGFVLHHRTAQRLGDIAPKPRSVSLLIGPEGGLSEAEIEQAIQAGLSPLSLGPRVLRTETAPIAALSILQYQWGDMACE